MLPALPLAPILIGDTRDMEWLGWVLLTVLLPMGLLSYLLVQLANQGLDQQLDHDWTEQKAQAAARKRRETWAFIGMCCFYMLVSWYAWWKG